MFGLRFARVFVAWGRHENKVQTVRFWHPPQHPSSSIRSIAEAWEWMKKLFNSNIQALPPEALHISMNACLKWFQALKSDNWIGDVAAENGILGPDSLDKLLLPSGPRRFCSQRHGLKCRSSRRSRIKQTTAYFFSGSRPRSVASNQGN